MKKTTLGAIFLTWIFFPQAVFAFGAVRGECGTDEILNGALPTSSDASQMSTGDRVRSCSGLPGSTVKTRTGVTWNLVARKYDPATGKFYEVWNDTNGQMWGDVLDHGYDLYCFDSDGYNPGSAVAMNVDGNVTEEKACVNEEGKRASAGVTGKSFGLPTIEEFQHAEKDGIREVLPHTLGYAFWSASIDPYNPDYAYFFNGNDGGSHFDYRGFGQSIRCVGR